MSFEFSQNFYIFVFVTFVIISIIFYTRNTNIEENANSSKNI